MKILVTALLIMAILFAKSAQKNRVTTGREPDIYGKYEQFQMLPFIMSFCILAGVCFFCKSGTDMPVYAEFYSSWRLSDLADLRFELGDKLLFILLHVFIKDPYIGLGVIKVLSIALVYKTLYVLRDKIQIGLAVLAYVALLYVFNFHLIRMMIALSLVFLGLAYELIGRRRKCIVLLVAAIFFHYTSCVVLIVYIGYLLFSRKFSVGKILILVVAILFVASNAVQIVSALTKISFFSKYTVYDTVSSEGSGIVQIVLFIPIALILLKNYRSEKDTAFYQLAFFCGIMTYFIESMGYVFSTIGRLAYYFYFFFIVYGAATPLKRNDILLAWGTFRINASTVLIYTVLLLRVYVYFVAGNALRSNGLLQYVTIFG